MSAPQIRRPLPALAFIGALTILTALVWYRVLNRSDGSTKAASSCPSASSSASAAPSTPSLLPRPRAVSVRVLNASGRDGLAAKTGKGLKKRGFRVTQVGNDGTGYGGKAVLKSVGQIRYGPQAQLSAVLLHYYLPHATMTATDSSSKSVILSLGTGFTTLVTAKSVAATLKTGHVTLGVPKSLPPTPRPSPSCSAG